MSDHEDIQHLDPDQLLSGFSKTPFTAFFLLSIILHAVVIAVFSLTALIELVAPSTVEEAEPVVEATEDVGGDETDTTAPDSSNAASSTESSSESPEAPANEAASPENNEKSSAAESSDGFDIDLDVLNTP